MHNEPRQQLCQLIAQYGRSLSEDPRRCGALLKDHCGQYKREIFVLVNALENRVATELINASAGVPESILLSRLSKRLEDELGLAETAAKWAVETWALALGVDIGGNLTPIGASANVVAYAYTEHHYQSIGWKRWLAAAVPATLLVMLVATGLVLWKSAMGWH